MTTKRSNRRGFLTIIGQITLVSVCPAFAESRSNFVEVKLPRGVSLSLPATWRIIGPTEEQMIQTSSEATLDVSGIPLSTDNDAVLIAANSMPLSTYAAVRVVSTSPSSISPSQLSAMTPSVLREVEVLMRDMVVRILTTQGHALVEFIGTRAERISGSPAMVTRYRRTGPQGPVYVQSFVVYTASQQLTVTASFRESEAVLWKPVIEKIRHSIVINR